MATKTLSGSGWLRSIKLPSLLWIILGWKKRKRSSTASEWPTDEEIEDVQKHEESSWYVQLLRRSTHIRGIGWCWKLGYWLDSEHSAVPTALLATASPCKFEESVTAALGEEGRNEFKEKFLPAKAAEFMAKDEVPPFVYTRASTGNHWPKSKSVGSSSTPACRKTCCHAIVEEEHGGGLASRFWG